MVGLNIRRMREEVGITQTKLAQVINIHQESLSRIELGRIKPSLTTLEKIAAALGVAISELFDDNEYIGRTS